MFYFFSEQCESDTVIGVSCLTQGEPHHYYLRVYINIYMYIYKTEHNVTFTLLFNLHMIYLSKCVDVISAADK